MSNKLENTYIFGMFAIMGCIIIILLITTIEVNNLREANENLKKEKYECKQELDKYKEKYLDMVIRG